MTPRQVIALVVARAVLFGAPLGLLVAFIGIVKWSLGDGGAGEVIFGFFFGAAWLGGVAGACAAAESSWPRRGQLGHDLVAGLLCIPVGALASVALVVQLVYAHSVIVVHAAPLQFERSMDGAHPSQAIAGALIGLVLGAGAVARRRLRPRFDVVTWTATAAWLPLLAVALADGRLTEVLDAVLGGLMAAVMIGGFATLLTTVADALAARWAPAIEPFP